MEPVLLQTQPLGWWAGRSTGTKVILGLLGVGLIIAGATFAVKHFKQQPDTRELDSSIEDELVSKLEKAVDQYTLPNKGIGCSEVRDTFDANCDYVKCNNIWYAKSKQNPANEATAGKYPEWTSIESSEVTTKLLNTRYPS